MSCKHLLQRDAPGKAIFLVSCVLVILALPCRYLGEHQAETTMLILAAPMAWCYLLFFCRWVTISFAWWVKITKYTIQSNFQFDVERDLRLHWFCFTSFCDWVRKLTPLSPPVRCRTKTNDDLIARVFSHFSGPSLPVFTVCSYWLLNIFFFFLIGRCYYFGFGFTTISRKALYFWWRRIPLGRGVCTHLSLKTFKVRRAPSVDGS